MDLVELLKEGALKITSDQGSLETVSKMSEQVWLIAQGSAPWHMSEEEVNRELYDTLKKVWNFSLGLEKRKTDGNPEYFGMLRYFCVGLMLFLVVERKVEDKREIGGTLKSLSLYGLVRMALHTGKICAEFVPDLEKAQYCFEVVVQQYGKVRDAGRRDEIQTVLRDVIRVLYSNGKIFQSDREDQEILKRLLLAASVLAKDFVAEGACFAAVCLRNGIRLAALKQHRKAAVWLTAASRNGHLMNDDSHACALKLLAQVYYDWGAIKDFPEAISGLDKANLLSFHPSGVFLKLKIILALRSTPDAFDEEIESLISLVVRHLDAGGAESVVFELRTLGHRRAARFALTQALTGSKDLARADASPHLLHLHMISVEWEQADSARDDRDQRVEAFKDFLKQDASVLFPDSLGDEKKRRLASKLHGILWKMARVAIETKSFRVAADWFEMSLKFLDSAHPQFQAVSGKLHRNLARCSVELKDFEAAQRHVDSSLRHQPDSLLSLYWNFVVHMHLARDTTEAFDRILAAGNASCNSAVCTVDLGAVFTMVLDDAVNLQRWDALSDVLKKIVSLPAENRARFSNQTVLFALRRCFSSDRSSSGDRSPFSLEWMRLASDLLKTELQRVDLSEGYRKSLFVEIDWWVPVAWNSVCPGFSGVTIPSADHFLLVYRFLALKEIRIREDGGEASTQLIANLDMQHQMLGRTVDAGLNKYRDLENFLRPPGGAGRVNERSQSEMLDSMETLYGVCEIWRRVLIELESMGGASDGLPRFKLMRHLSLFEICAKSKRESELSSILADIKASVLIINSVPAQLIFDSLVQVCADPPADRQVNCKVICDCFVLAVEARTTAPFDSRCAQQDQTVSRKIFDYGFSLIQQLIIPREEATIVAERVSDVVGHYLRLVDATAVEEEFSGVATRVLSLCFQAYHAGMFPEAERWSGLALEIADKFKLTEFRGRVEAFRLKVSDRVANRDQRNKDK